MNGFPSTFRSCASLQNPSGLTAALQRLTPTGKAVPLLAPRTVNSGRGPCSPGLPVSRALPSGNRPKSVSLFDSPLVLRPPTALRPQGTGTSGSLLSPTRRLPPKRAPARLTFLTDCARNPFEKWTRRGLFFPLPPPSPLTKSQSKVFAADPLPPTGRLRTVSVLHSALV
jgi:hypothetical protein